MRVSIKNKIRFVWLAAIFAVLIGVSGLPYMSVSAQLPSSGATPSAPNAPNLTEDLFSDSTIPGIQRRHPFITRSRFVRINRNLLMGGTRFVLNMFGDRSIIAVLDRRQDRREAVGPGGGDGFIWRGHIEGLPSSQVNLVVGPNVVTGRIDLPDSNRQFALWYAGDGTNGIHVVYEIDPSLMPRDLDPVQGTPSAPGNPDNKEGILSSSLACPSCELNPTVINIGLLVVYTPKASSDAGGGDAIKNLIVAGVDWTNKALAYSEVDAQFILKDTRLVEYEEVDPGTDLGRLAGTDDEWMPEVHIWRDQVGADLVSLVGRESNGVCCQGRRGLSAKRRFCLSPECR